MSDYILLAETDPFQLSRFRELVLNVDLEVVVARDGLDARGTIKRRGAPVLLVTALSLPLADGFSVVRELRKVSATARVVVHSVFPGLRATAERLKQDLGIESILDASPTSDDIKVLASQQGVLRKAIREAPEKIERRRLATLEAMGLRSSDPPEQELQQIVDKVAADMRMPVALVSLVYKDIQFFKAHVGLAGELLIKRGTPRDWSFCQHVAEADRPRPLIVPDAREHPTFKDSPLVRDGLVVSYLGAPIVTPTGEILGSLCVTDTQPRQFDIGQVDTMIELARRVAGELELIAARRQAAEAAARGQQVVAFSMRQLGAIFGTLEVGVLISDEKSQVVYVNPALMHHFGLKPDMVVGKPRDVFVELLAGESRQKTLVRHLLSGPSVPFAAREEFDLERPRPRHFRWVSKPLPLAEGLGQVCYFVDLTAQAEREGKAA